MFLGAKRLGAGSISKKKMHYLLSISFDFFHQQFLLYFLVQCSSYNKKAMNLKFFMQRRGHLDKMPMAPKSLLRTSSMTYP